MKSKIFPSLALALGLMAQNGQAADIVSGPPTGTPLAPVNSYALHGPHKGREFAAAKSLGQGPGALLFIHALSRNIIPVLRGLDDLTSEYSVLGFRSHTLLLHDDRTSAENRLKAVNGSLKQVYRTTDAHPIILSLDGLEGPGDYALNRRAALTIVLAKGGPILLAEGGRFQIQGRVKNPGKVTFGLSAANRDRSIRGEFSASRQVESNFDIEIPVAEFQPFPRGDAVSAAGLEVSSWFCFTTEPSLTITHVELLAP